MADFADLLKRGRRMFDMKNKSGSKWFKCEECGERRFCYPYDDDKDETWYLCEQCANLFVKDEEL